MSRLEEKAKQAADKQRQIAQWAAVKKYVADHPGTSHRTAYNVLLTDKPHLFRDLGEPNFTELDDVRHKNSELQYKIHDAINQLRAAKPMTFAKAFNEIRKTRPELFAFDEAPTPSRGYDQPSPGTQQSMIKLAAAQARAHLRSIGYEDSLVHASRPEPEEVTVQGGFVYDIVESKMLVTQPDGSLVEAVSE
jgi:hypothetical protein